jgi:hypothetical protein
MGLFDVRLFVEVQLCGTLFSGAVGHQVKVESPLKGTEMCLQFSWTPSLLEVLEV